MTIAINQIEKIISVFVPDTENRKTVINLINGFIIPNNNGVYIRPSTAATMLDCDERLVLKLIKEGKLKAKRMESGHIRIYRSSLDKYIEALPEAFDSDREDIKKQVDNFLKGVKLCKL